MEAEVEEVVEEIQDQPVSKPRKKGLTIIIPQSIGKSHWLIIKILLIT